MVGQKRVLKNMGTSIGMLEKHYSHLTPTLGANKLAGKRFPDLMG
jgi:hypothetical protein